MDNNYHTLEPVIIQLYDGDDLVNSTPVDPFITKPYTSNINDYVYDVTISGVFATKVRLYKNTPGNSDPINFREVEVWGAISVSRHSFFFSSINAYYEMQPTNKKL